MPGQSSNRRGRRIGAEQSQFWRITWRQLPGRAAISERELLDECAALFSAHYGRWGDKGKVPGAPVRIGPGQLRSLLDHDGAWISCAFLEGALVGYCIAVDVELPNRGRVAWVSQLVVHNAYRHARIGTRLLYSMWQFSDCYAWGLATTSPYGIRALETATRRPCRAKLIGERGDEVLQAVAQQVEYLPTRLVREDDRPQPRVDTQFFLDHDHVPGMRREAARSERPWALGELADGLEWLGCTFSDQEPSAMDDEHLTELLTGSDEIWIDAYERMTLDDDHRWRAHAPAETDFIVERCGLGEGSRVLDVGCGDGRHVAELAERGIDAVGVDISERLIDRAKASVSFANAHFELADARQELPGGSFDAVLALYDVLGSSARRDDDEAMLKLMASRLAPGGYLVVSVMNSRVTERAISNDRRPRTNSEFIAVLESLLPSKTMEQTGAVFDPELLLVYRDVHYRKEQFREATWQLSSEMVVRDRRFTLTGIADEVQGVGLDVMDTIPVQSGNWDRDPHLDESDKRAKEILVLARKVG